MSKMETRPIIIDVKRQTRKRIKQLKNGRGKLMDAVNEAIREAHPTLSATDALPVVVLIEKKPGKGKRGRMMFPLLGGF